MSMNMITKINQDIEGLKFRSDNVYDTGEISDGYHTFNELYEFRKVYNAALFNIWSEYDIHEIYKSQLHFNGKVPFDDKEWFIVVAILPTGQVSNHYKMEDWEMFKMPEFPKAKHEYDGHTSSDVLDRLRVAL